ncbi:MAG TPA: phosphatase PAP2 family protein [Candidatus Nanoarchaeia archaeon]|nr:phosphatase PAP2 family protein [Candidatus Nanoarchaeia archaeon]
MEKARKSIKWIVAAAAFYVVAIALLVLGFYYDAYVSEFIASNRQPYLNEFMRIISFLGDWYIILIIISIIFIFHKLKRRLVFASWLSILASGLIVYAIKFFFVRERPFGALGIENLIEAEGSSFPSGHAAAAFSAVPLIGRIKKLRHVWLAFSILVAFSRIYLGVHYLSDVAAGALIGYTLGAIFLAIEHKAKFGKRILELIKRYY